jgi:alkanesulfonate monooxygenase SsuD/methylene tetrahydromethanopterin reductase-like flavin-dependent oxidoreductase (luciferase family)
VAPTATTSPSDETTAAPTQGFGDVVARTAAAAVKAVLIAMVIAFVAVLSSIVMWSVRASVISKMLSGGAPDATTTVHGEHARVESVTCVPGPFNATMPLWTGGRGRTRTPDNAARFCSGWNVPYVDPTEFRRLNDRLDAACEAIDRDPATLERSVNLAFHLGATAADAQAELDRIEQQWGPEVAPRVTGGALTGTPDRAVERIAEYRAAGADLVNVALRLPVQTEALGAYLDEVVPAARRLA